MHSLRLRRGNIRTGLIVAGCLVAEPTPHGLVLAYVLILLGCALHLWSKGCLRQNREVTTCGPYRWTRNPFYLANLLVDAGLLAAISRWWLALLYLSAWAILYRREIEKEEGLLDLHFRDAFRTYRAKVPRFFPRIRPALRAAESSGRFSWSSPNLLAGIEYARLVRFLAAPVLVVLASGLVRDRFAVSPGDVSYYFTGGVLCGCLFAIEMELLVKFRNGSLLLPRILFRKEARTTLAVAFPFLVFFLAWPPIVLSRAAFTADLGAGAALLVAILFVAGRAPLSLPVLLGAAALADASLAELPWLGIVAGTYGVLLAVDRFDSRTDGGSAAAVARDPSRRKAAQRRFVLTGYAALLIAVALGKELAHARAFWI